MADPSYIFESDDRYYVRMAKEKYHNGITAIAMYFHNADQRRIKPPPWHHFLDYTLGDSHVYVSDSDAQPVWLKEGTWIAYAADALPEKRKAKNLS